MVLSDAYGLSIPDEFKGRIGQKNSLTGWKDSILEDMAI
jgi:hypothetical protein